MESEPEVSLAKRARRFFLGKARSATEPGIFHTMSLAAFLAWVGLGSDGISSACYGPEEAFKALHGHSALALILALMTALTVFVISASYMQIVELFPTGGGGYLVASKLLSPSVGMVAGCALVIDYVLTVVVSLAAGADAVLSFLPESWGEYKVPITIFFLGILVVLNLRGVKESVVPVVPIFLVFMLTYLVAIVIAVTTHMGDLPTLFDKTTSELQATRDELRGSWLLVGLLVLKAYSLGGGTYTGIEAVSNGMQLLREPRVETGKRTMIYMSISLAVLAGGLIVSYLLFDVHALHEAARAAAGDSTGDVIVIKTYNALLFEQVSSSWPSWIGNVYVWSALVSSALILIVAAQTGMLSGPRVLANMALDGWMPNRFALLSDRLVSQNGIIIMGLASLAIILFSRGDVGFLVVLYSINVFMTFTLSQLGMVRHWFQVRRKGRPWAYGLTINLIGLGLTTLILVATTVLKFTDGGWLTLVVTGSFIVLCVLIKRHYNHVRTLLGRLNALVKVATPAPRSRIRAGDGDDEQDSERKLKPQPDAHTAIILVTGYNGLGLHSIYAVMRQFQSHYKNFVFLQVGVVDAGRFKGADEIEALRATVEADLGKYVEFMNSNGFYAMSHFSIGTDVVEEVERSVLEITKQFPRSVLFAGQLVFPKETFFTRWLHNYTAFAIQRKLYRYGLPVFILPIQVY